MRPTCSEPLGINETFSPHGSLCALAPSPPHSLALKKAGILSTVKGVDAFPLDFRRPREIHGTR